ncbi:hypothetical protein NM04_07155 [Massilia aurea]|uniref:Uncharacterized protein n=1 Tax=Massilia aurea TaxID=373040 RepID=A0A422QN77_9BURK|nr:hypothetical protein [Massilia aurea]RNF31447.1 hypothetical protein NM04_07155 [Massilia aurea]
MQLNAEQKRRIERLREGAWPADKLGWSDLLLLLRHDPDLRSLIAEIARQPGLEPVDMAEASADPVPAPAPVPVAIAPDPLRTALSGPLRLHALVERDEALCLAWLAAPLAADGSGLTRLIANASHWDRIEALWDVLAQRCKHAQRAATPDETAIVEECVRIHNLLWEGRQAITVPATAGDGFDFGIHERGNAAGQAVRQSWLPGLKNAAGQLRKKTLVYTV